ncbi:MAG TPA: energy-coupling factor transporter ATPase [Dictyobacter sp.]|jgi:energy-coupling factor transport system ATP-binding protein|nr:energy-coupling factor transporter ATPase [Dictyobacter sp.]
MNEPIIRVRHLSHVYTTGFVGKKALDNVTLEVKQGSCVAIIGLNGSGKSTLIQHFNGLLRPSEGEVWVDGLNVGEKGVDLRQLRQRVGMLFQFPEAQLFEKTVFADVAFGPRRMKLGRREVRRRVLAALDTVGLPPSEYAWRSPFDLSGGQRRRIALAGILAMSPRILILDEPSVGLDGAGRDEFYLYVRRVQQQGVTVLLVSHDMSEVASMADWLFVLADGRLVLQGRPGEVFSEESRLGDWGLIAPSLQVLMAALRKQGIDVPADIQTLDDVYAFLLQQKCGQLPGKAPGS